MGRTKLATTVGIAAALFALEARAVEPMSCFQRFAQPSSLSTSTAHATTMPVTLATTFHPAQGCVYGLSPELARMVPVPEMELDFATLVERLAQGGAPPHAPHTIYARVRDGGRALESVFRESCTDVLFSDGLAFEARVDTSTRLLHVRRQSLSATPQRAGNLSDCGASRVTLRFVPFDDATPPPSVARVSGSAERELGVERRELILGAPGRFAVYAARPSEPGDPRPALLVGRLALDSPLTELRRAMSTPAREDQPWFRSAWRGDRLVFARAEGTENPTLWHEAVLAASSEQLWLTDVPSERSHDPPRVHGPLRVTPERDGFVLPDGMVDGAMRARFGAAGAVMTPTLREWDSLRRGLQVCVAERYARTRAESSPAQLPADTRCARLANVSPAITLAAAQAAEGAGASATPQQACLRRSQWRLNARGMVAERALPEACVALGEAPGARPLIASVGDRVTLSGDPAGRHLCIENHCRAMTSATSERGIRVWRAGLAELRQASSAEGATSREALTLMRFVAIDPLTDLHPVGVARGAAPRREAAPEDDADRGDELRGGAWSTVDHDEIDVFAYVRRRNAMRFYLTTTAAAAGVWNALDSETVLTTQLPVVGGVQRSEVSPPPSGLVVLLTRDDRCPTEPSSGVRARPPFDPDARLPDQTVHAFLARDLGATEPYECIAHAAFRVREARAIAPTSWLHLGVLGDAQAAFFLAEPFAFGVVYPVGFAHARLPVGFHVEGAVSVTAAVNFADGELSRAGAGVSLALGWGPLGLAPRLVSVGAMLHLATGSANDNPWVSPYVALNLSTLIDALGGR